jgi:hypothetical protein
MHPRWVEHSIAALVARMESDLERLADPRRHFHGTYLRTTVAVGEEIARGGFADNAWLERWDLVFAELNAHINYDLPQALIAVITPEEFDDAVLLERREADHRHVDECSCGLPGEGLG